MTAKPSTTYGLDEIRRQAPALRAEPDVVERPLEAAAEVVASASSPIQDQGDVFMQARVTIEESDGNPAPPRAVYIRNLESRPLTVVYTRTVDNGGQTSRSTTMIPAKNRTWIGYSCNTISYGSLCSRYIYTRIASAN